MACSLCRLCETCNNICQMGTGKRGARIMIVQENPFQTESRKGEYMTGKPGALFKAALGEVGIDLDEVYFTALVKCATPEDRMPIKDEIQACGDYLWAEIDVVKPEIIIPTGAESLKFLTGLTSITKQRGRLIEKDGYKFFPIIHPALVLKQPKYMDFFTRDIINLEAILNGSIPEDVVSHDKQRRYCETYRDAIDEINRFRRLPKGSMIVVDLETVKTNPYIPNVEISEKAKAQYPTSGIPKIVGVGLSDRSGYGCAIPLHHRETPFMGHELGVIIKSLRDLFANPNLIFVGHNGKFDKKWLSRLLDITICNYLYDTMMLHYLLITEEKGTHGLKELAWLETDMGGYDDALDDVKPKGVDEGNYDIIPWDVLKVYLADDCDCTYRLLDKYLPMLLENEEVHWLWKDIVLPGLNALEDIEANGVFVDEEWLAKLEESYPKEIQRIDDKLHEFPEVLSIEREKEAMWEERCAILRIPKAQRTPEQQKKFEVYKKYDPKNDGTKFNFGSTQQLKDLMFERLGLSTVVLTDKGEYSTNDDSLKYMKPQHPICDVLMEYRKVQHLYNNFVAAMRGYMDTDRLIHPSYLMHGTVTGRLSSQEPNFQQMPRKSNEPMLFQYWNDIKRLFTSRFGDEGVILQFDYSQLELRILAVFSQDKNLIGLYKSGVDLHRAIAAEAFNKPMEEITKDERTASKKIQFGIVYQESAQGLSDDLRSEGIDMSVQDCEVFIDKYFKKYPQVKKWVDNTKRFAKRNKYVKTLTNRIRHLPSIDSSDRYTASEATRQAVNAPIQGTGSECTIQSIIQINKWLKKTGKKSVMAGTVHDSIVLDCRKDEVIEVAKKCKHIMEHLAEYDPFYSFLGEVPIVSESEIGFSYGESFECTIEELEEQGVDNFILGERAKKYEKERHVFQDAHEKGIKIPEYAERYWTSYIHDLEN